MWIYQFREYHLNDFFNSELSLLILFYLPSVKKTFLIKAEWRYKSRLPYYYVSIWFQDFYEVVCGSKSVNRACSYLDLFGTFPRSSSPFYLKQLTLSLISSKFFSSKYNIKFLICIKAPGHDILKSIWSTHLILVRSVYTNSRLYTDVNIKIFVPKF